MTNEPEVIKGKYQKKRKRRRKARTVFILAFVFIAACMVFGLYSPAFNLQSIDVQGSSKLSKDYIISRAAIPLGQNIFKINSWHVADVIKNEPYVENVEIKRKLPNRILIRISERSPQAVVQYMGSYVLIDKNGVALETRTSIEDTGLVEIKGIEFDKLLLGKPIVQSDSENLNVALGVLTLMHKGDLLHYIGYVDVKDLSRVKVLLDGRFDVALGSSAEMNPSGLYKRILFLKKILEEEKDAKGQIDMTNKESPRVIPDQSFQTTNQEPDVGQPE